MDYKGIQDIIKSMSESKLTFLEIESDGTHIVMKKEQFEKVVVHDTAPRQIAEVQVENRVTKSVEPAIEPITTIETELGMTEESLMRQKQSESNTVLVTSPIVGTFYSASGPGSAPFVSTGSKVKKGDVLCIIEAMKLMNEIESEYDGEIEEILVQNEQMIEYGQPLFRIRL